MFVIFAITFEMILHIFRVKGVVMILPQNNFGMLLENLSYFLLFNDLHVQSILLALLVLLNALLQQDLVGQIYLILLLDKFSHLSGLMLIIILLLLRCLLDLR